MEQTNNILNLYSKMSAITNELTSVAKNLNVGTGQTAYKAVGEADVLAAVKPLENKYRIYSYPVEREIVASSIIEKEELDYKTKERKLKKSLFLRVKTIYRFVNIDNATEFLDIVSYGDGVDTQDKAPGKAMTYSDKYALMKAYKIITGDDPDQYKSEPLYNYDETPYNSQPQPQKAPYSASYQQQPTNTYQQPQMQNTPQNQPEKMTGEQAVIIYNLTDQAKALVCQKLGINDINLITRQQADVVINALRGKGAIQ